MSESLLIIDNENSQATNNSTFTRCNPVTGEVATVASAATIADVDSAAAAAQTAFPGWAATPPAARRAILLKAADLMEKRSAEFADAIVRETGSTPGWGFFNASFGASLLREAAAMTTQITGETIPSNRPGTIAMAIRQPVGVLLGIAPWNAPVILGVRAIAMPIACGNTVIFKSSEFCPKTHFLIVDVLREAGLPPGVVNLISNAPEDGPRIVEALVTHPVVKRINFTGSTRVGKIIASLAARDLKPVLLELGGKSPLLVLDDADLDQAVGAAAFGAFMNQGQICMSTERVIVDDKIAEDFVSRFAAKAESLIAGEPTRQGVMLGAVASQATVARFNELLDDAVAKGAEIRAGGRAESVVINATVVDKVTANMKLFSEESFGPIVSVIRARDTEDAIAIANNSEYGLSAAVFGRDGSRTLDVAQRIESGICHINGPTVFDEGQMPFGGVKSSGYGRFGGKAGIDEFTETRWVTINTKPIHYPI